jgi:hypothetical protein
MERGQDLEGYAAPVGLASGLVMLLAAWLPWLTVSYATQPASLVASQTQTGFSSWHGKLTMLCGIALVAAALLRKAVSSVEWRTSTTGIWISSGLVALGAGLHQILWAHPGGGATGALRASWSPSIGLYLTLAAAAGALLAGYLGFEPEPKPASKPADAAEPVNAPAGPQPR